MDEEIPPAGVSPASAWEDAEGSGLVTSAPVGLAPKYDPTTGERTSLLTNTTPLLAALTRQFRTERGTGVSVLNDGRQSLAELKRDKTAPTVVRAEVERIIEPFVRDELLSVDTLEVTVPANPAGIVADLGFFDNTRRARDDARGVL